MKFSSAEWEGFSIEKVPQFNNERRTPDLYDPSCLRLNTGVRAIWLLFRRSKWDLLAQIGLPRWKYEAKFVDFDLKFITSDHGLLRLEEQAERFADAVPGVRIAASNLIERYEALFPDQVHSYYNKLLRKLDEERDEA